MTILRIAIPCPLRRLFDYLPAPAQDISLFQIGARVNVSFGKRQLIGIIVALADNSELDIATLKHASVIDETPLLPDDIVKLCLWASDYYHYPVGEVFSAALPKLMREKNILPSPAKVDIFTQTFPALILNAEQQHAVDNIIQAKQFQVFLLQGITGSGKTEVYLQAINAILQNGGQALVLVPEISLTPQTVSRFTQRFCVPVAVIHSDLSDKNRAIAWLQAKTGVARIVIGTRSSVFTPMPELQLIVIDEEHDLSFKQQDGFRYSARDVAIRRAQMLNVPVVLGSATPALESVHNAKQKKYQTLLLTQRAGHAKLPEFKLLDIRKQKLHHGLSPILIKKIQYHVENGHQVLLFLNRRGYAPTLMCHDCGWLAGCPNCDARLTFHQKKKQLHCHHCDYRNPIFKKCNACGSTDLLALGQGTERIETALQEFFPAETIARIDRDTTRKKNELYDHLEKIHAGQYHILVGTQMLAKGHHFPRVTLVAILEADQSLFSHDFRAFERLGQLLTQVAGRAGRAQDPGEVVIQTHYPEHPLLLQLINEGYAAFADTHLQERYQAQLPPASYMALLRAEAPDVEQAQNFLEAARNLASPQDISEISVLGPLPASLARKQGHFRVELLLQSKHRPRLQQFLTTWIPKIETLKYKQVRWSLDIDPVSFG